MAFWNKKNISSSDGILRGKELRDLLKERKEERKLENDDQFETHPLWHVILFIGLVVIFFPWSLLLLLLIFGWDGTVQLFRGLVIGTIGLAAFLLIAAVVLMIIILAIALVFGA